MNGLTLAYIGDAYYELQIRNHLLNKGYTHVKQLHSKAIKYTSSIAQANIVQMMIDNNILLEDEINAYKRGRNNSTSGRKNVDGETYAKATGFESIIGYLYLEKNNRLDLIVNISINYIDKGDLQ